MLDFRIMQMADSALPTGGFAYSQGLESAAYLGLATSDSLPGYLLGFLQQAAGFEIPFLNSFFWGEDADHEYDATFLAPWMHQASLVQGRSLARLWEWRSPASCHYLPVLARGLRDEGWPLPSLQRLYLHMVLRDQISAAIRLNLIGPLRAAALGTSLHDEAERLRARYGEARLEQAARRGPLLDLIQGCHHRLYSRLFQS